jgi:hypothetical protein
MRVLERTLVFLLPLSLFALAGCGADDTTGPGGVLSGAPDASVQALPPDGDASSARTSRNGFFPLQNGNYWHYAGSTEIISIPYGEPGPPVMETMEYTEERTLVGTEMIAGREYVIEEARIDWDFGDTDYEWRRYRQDRSGLYEADVSIDTPPGPTRELSQAAAARGLPADRLPASNREAWSDALRRLEQRLEVARHAAESGSEAMPPIFFDPGELTRLRYPLKPGLEWTVREVPFFGSVVESPEVLNLEPGRLMGFRIRMVSEVYEPGDLVRSWYGRRGLLKFSAHVNSLVVGMTGDTLGTLVLDDLMVLDDLSLEEPGRFESDDASRGRFPVFGFSDSDDRRPFGR